MCKEENHAEPFQAISTQHTFIGVYINKCDNTIYKFNNKIKKCDKIVSPTGSKENNFEIENKPFCNV